MYACMCAGVCVHHLEPYHPVENLFLSPKPRNPNPETRNLDPKPEPQTPDPKRGTRTPNPEPRNPNAHLLEPRHLIEHFLHLIHIRAGCFELFLAPLEIL